jgi:hypothetical protein
MTPASRAEDSAVREVVSGPVVSEEEGSGVVVLADGVLISIDRMDRYITALAIRC